MDEWEAYQNISKALGFSDYSPLLIQYGSITTLRCVLESKELWFGDLNGMNDCHECNHFIDAVYNSLNEIVPDEFVSDAQRLVEKHRNQLKARSYASSWCEYTSECPSGDNGMWSKYCSPSDPIAFVIDSTQFMPSQINAKRKDFFVFSTRVNYVKKDRAADLLQQDLRKLRALGLLEDNMQNCILAAFLLLAKAPGVKHESFRSESEIRFLFSPELLEMMGKEIPLLKYHNACKNGLARTYLRFPLKSYPEFDFDFSIQRILRKVLIGPSKNQQQNEAAVEELLRQQGLEHVKVEKSDSPLRW